MRDGRSRDDATTCEGIDGGASGERDKAGALWRRCWPLSPGAFAQAKFWLFRYTRSGKMREMGLGPAKGRTAVSLSQARAKARQLHEAVREGRDPLAERDAEAKQSESRRSESRSRRHDIRRRGGHVHRRARGLLAQSQASPAMAQHAAIDYVLPVIGDLPVT